MLLLRGPRNAGCIPAHAQPFSVVRQHHRGRIWREKFAMVTRAMLLVAIGQRQRAVESIRMRARQDGERGEPLWIFVGDPPRDAAAPVVTDEMKAHKSELGCNLHRIVAELVEDVIIGVRRIGPGARRVAALAGCDDAITGARQRRALRTPVMERFRKTVQQEYGRALLWPVDQHVEGEARCSRDLAYLGHHATR